MNRNLLIFLGFFSLNFAQGQTFADTLISSGPCNSSGITCPSGVTNPTYAVDASPDNYALMFSQLGTSLLESSGFLEVGFKNPAFAGETIGIVVESTNEQLNADVVDNFTIIVFDEEGNPVAADSALSLQDISLLSATSGRHVIRIPTPVADYRIAKVRIALEGGVNVLQEAAVYGIFHEVSCPPQRAAQVAFSVNVEDPGAAVDNDPESYAVMNLPVSVANEVSGLLELDFPNAGLAGDFVGFEIAENNTLLAADLIENLTIVVFDINGVEVARENNFTLADLMLLDTAKTILASLLGVGNGNTPRYIAGFNTPPGNYSIGRIRLELTSTLGVFVDLRIYSGLLYSKLRGVGITASSLVIAPDNTVTLTADEGYASYTWSNGATGNPITVTGPGTYTVVAQRAGDECLVEGSITLLSDPCKGQLVFADELVAYGNCEPIVPLVCPSGVENPGFAVDGDTSNFALMVSQLGTSIIESTSFLEVSFSEPGHGGNEVGVFIRTINQNLNADVVDHLTLIIFDEDSNEVGRFGNLSLQNIGLLSGLSTRNALRIQTVPGNYRIKRIRLEMEGGVNVLQDLGVYGFYYNCSCPAIIGSRLLDHQQAINPGQAADADPETYAVLNLPLSLGSSAFIEVGFAIPAKPGDYVGFTIAKNNTLLQAGLIENLSIAIFDEEGTLRSTEEDFTLADLVAAEQLSGLLGGLVGVGNQEGITPYAVGFSTPADTGYRIGSIRLLLNPTIGILSDLRVYEAFYLGQNGLSVSGSVTALCSGGQATLTGSPGYTHYRWSNGAEGRVITVTEPGLYTLTADRPEDGCPSTASFIVEQSTGFDLDLDITQPDCDSAGSVVARVTNGSGNYSYTWFNLLGQQLDSNEVFENAANGIYLVKVKDLVTGCEEIGKFELNNEPDINFDILQPACDATGRIVAHVAGGTGHYAFAYTRSGSQQVLSTDTILVNAASGIYMFTATDTLNNCVYSRRLELNDVNGPDVNGYVRNATCNDTNGAIFIDVRRGYTVTWEHGAAGATLYNLAAGTYTAMVKDSAGCATIKSFTVLNQNDLDLEISVTRPACDSGMSGTIDLNVRGGSGQFSYLWSNGATTQDIFNLKAGIYVVIVTDLNTGCQDFTYIAVSDVSGPDITLELLKEETCFGTRNGLLRIGNVSSSDSIRWSTGQNTREISGLAPGIYTVEVTNEAGCSSFQQFPIIARDTLANTFDVTHDCEGHNNGTVRTSVTGGHAPYTYTWDNEEGLDSLSGLKPGTYHLRITDVNGCVFSDSATVQLIRSCDDIPGEEEGEKIFIPQLITPNWDGYNDVWKIDSLPSLKNLAVEVFNRYGEMVFESSNYKNNWAGTYRDTGLNLPDGTYFYHVNVTTISRKERKFTGFVVIKH